MSSILKALKKIWKFIWEEDSILSWIINIIIAFILVKFVIYPGLGLLLQTTHPVVAVVSGSMEHSGSFEDWWAVQHQWYEERNFTKDVIKKWPLSNGFNKGDIMVLYGTKIENIKKGDVIVFKGKNFDSKTNIVYYGDPIIHRAVNIWQEEGNYYMQTKGDHNEDSFEILGESKINKDRLIGKAIFRIPLLGWIKIWFVDLMG